jgi:hypothetical protein
MVHLGERHHGSTTKSFRASIDGYAAALSPRKRSSLTLVPLSHEKTVEPQQDTDETPSISSSKNSSNASKHSNIMSFFSFSKFTGKNKSKLSINIEEPKQPPPKSVSTTPVTTNSQQGGLSVPIVDQPLPSPNVYKSLEQYPLCVAYVQAIKHSLLPACTISSEKILRQEQAAKTQSRRGRALNRHAPTKSTDLDWTKKLFVLVPGLLLQYSGEGTDDRLPEKILELTASSLAFASDAIPGRPWVLQVYRSAGVDGGHLPDRKNAFVAKVTFKGAMKYSASAMLLVFESAEDMEMWMAILRSEAVRLGGGIKRSTSPKVGDLRPGTATTEAMRSDTGEAPEHEWMDFAQDIQDIQEIQEIQGLHNLQNLQDLEGYTTDREYNPRRGTINRDDWSSDDYNSKRASTYTSTDGDRSVISTDQLVLDALRDRDYNRNLRSPDTSPERTPAASYKRRSLQDQQIRNSVDALSDFPPVVGGVSKSPRPSPIHRISYPGPAHGSPSTSELSTPRQRPRPVSYQTIPTHTVDYYGNHLAVPDSRINRRSYGSAISVDIDESAPPGSPPSMPLPKVPSPVVDGLSQSMPRVSGNWAAMEKRAKRRSRQKKEMGLGIMLGVEQEQ